MPMAIDVQDTARQHFDRIHRAALVLSGNPWDADDLAQETFLVLSRQGSTFEGRSSLYTWLYGILLNLERRERRRVGGSARRRTRREPCSRKPAAPGQKNRCGLCKKKYTLFLLKSFHPMT